MSRPGADESKSKPRVYALDSSPISTGKAMNAAGTTQRKPTSIPSSSSSSKFGSSFTKNIARAGTSSKAGPSSSRPGMLGEPFSPQKNKTTTLDLDRYRYDSPQVPRLSNSYLNNTKSHHLERTNGAKPPPRPPLAKKKSVSDAETISSDSSSGESEDEERPQKKRRFRRGRAPSSPDQSPAKPPTAPKTTVQQSPIVISDSGDDAGSSWQTQARRLSKLFQGHFSVEDCVKVVKSCDGNSSQAMSILGKRREQGISVRSSLTGSARVPSIGASRAPLSAASNGQRSGAALTGVRNPPQVGQPLKRPVEREETKRRGSDSDDSDGSSAGGRGRGGWDSGSDSDRENSRRARAAVKWFNEATEQTLVETIGCSAGQAKIIDELRPFDTADDAEEKLRSAKGVTGKLFTDYIDLLASFSVVDQVLKKCEKRADRLEKACSPEALASDPLYLKDKPRSMARDVVLKDYQLDGVNWLSLRYRNQTSCILADDMGTGKTCQVIAFLCDLKDQGVKGVNLVVAPSSTIENWSRELKRFGPKLNVVVFAGSQSERKQIRYDIEEDHDDLDVILSSYNSATAATDIKFFKKFGFNCCVYDEGHQLKNQNTLNYRHLMQVGAEWRLLLTGTPLQNNLLELMSLLNFIMPRDFKHASAAMETIFKAKGNARDSQLSKSRVDRAKRMMGPFVLRRLKDKVLTLPPKKIQIEYCDMTPHQAKIYKKVLARTRLELMEQDDEAKAARKKKDQSSNILMRLRKGAIHPMMFRTFYTAEKIQAFARDYVKEPQFMDSDLTHLQEDFAINSDAELSQLAAQYPHTRKHQVPGSSWLNSGKIKTLRRLIDDIRSRGEKLVVFSQFEMALFLLMSALDEMKVSWIAFSGRTKVEERQSVIDEFQTNPDIAVFLLTTKAGGVGVNLTAANWVIMLDQDFNPQNDKQAEDRCWRIGQEKEVTVVKLISKGTIDEDILALGQQKLELAARVSGMESGAAAAASGSNAASGTQEASVADGKDGKEGIVKSASADVSTAASEALLEDDATQQDKTAKSLLSKLRSKVQARAEAKEGGGTGDALEISDDDDDDDGTDVEIL